MKAKAKAKAKSNAGRPRIYPVGSVVRRTKIEPVLDAALMAYCEAQDVRPAVASVLTVALATFLRDRGFFPFVNGKS
jgi:hypothetical protein